jgi:hypothetical protein
MPESLQNAEKGEKAQEAIQQMEDAIRDMETARDALTDAKE